MENDSIQYIPLVMLNGKVGIPRNLRDANTVISAKGMGQYVALTLQIVSQMK